MKYILGLEGTSHTLGFCVTTKEGEILFEKRNTYFPTEGLNPIEVAQVHKNRLIFFVSQFLKKFSFSEIQEVVWSKGPGFGSSLRVVAAFCRGLKLSYPHLRFYGVHHGLAHIYSHMFLNSLKDPLVVFLSGGHSCIGFLKNNSFCPLLETTDIPLGNFFDKVGRLLGIGGYFGPVCEEYAKKNIEPLLKYPSPKIGSTFTFSGLLEKTKAYASTESKERICASLQETCFNAILEGLEQAYWFSPKQEVILTGGVASNKALQDKVAKFCEQNKLKYVPTSEENNRDSGRMFCFSKTFIKTKENSLEELVHNSSWNFISEF